MPSWVVPTLKWGGVVLATVSAIALIYVQFIAAAPAPETEVAPNQTLVTLCWVFLVTGIVVTIAAIVVEQRQGPT
jgi:hypothetical protein